jgi:hypothetical protein
VPGGLPVEELEGYWQRRWVAVMALESMANATDAIPSQAKATPPAPGTKPASAGAAGRATVADAIPLLEAIFHEPNARPWVAAHVPRVLDVLRSKAKKPAGD